MIFNPLEQFRIMVLQKMFFGNVDISITNNTIILFVILIGFTFLFYINYSTNTYIPSKWQYSVENIYVFVLQLFKQQINNIVALRYFPLVLFVFSFILIANLIGLLPYGFTITGHIIFTFQIAFSLFFGITLINIINNKLEFLNLFVPSGVPKPLIPFLIVIEVVSYLIRPFSLSVRLFANMLAGHTLLNILSAFIFNVFKKYALISFLPLLFIVFIIVLEFCIAIVQAYIFSILTCIYLNDIYNTSH
jgi:F-type H+-transporting ATPase subunit a